MVWYTKHPQSFSSQGHQTTNLSGPIFARLIYIKFQGGGGGGRSQINLKNYHIAILPLMSTVMATLTMTVWIIKYTSWHVQIVFAIGQLCLTSLKYQGNSLLQFPSQIQWLVVLSCLLQVIYAFETLKRTISAEFF